MTLNCPQRLQAICKENDDEEDDDHVKPSAEHVLEGSAIQALSVDIVLSLHTYPQSDHNELPSRHCCNYDIGAGCPCLPAGQGANSFSNEDLAKDLACPPVCQSICISHLMCVLTARFMFPK